jgi:hypothetical protein
MLFSKTLIALSISISYPSIQLLPKHFPSFPFDVSGENVVRVFSGISGYECTITRYQKDDWLRQRKRSYQLTLVSIFKVE